jgi:hypothetical protein
MLGNPPVGLLAKNIVIWATEAAQRCDRFTHDLLSHISASAPSLAMCLSSDSEDLSDEEEEDLFSPLIPPPPFTVETAPQYSTALQPLHPDGRSLLGKHIYYKWPGDGWCLGRITEWNSDPTVKYHGKFINFKVYYACDDTTALTVLCLNNYNTDNNGLASDHSWVFLSQGNPAEIGCGVLASITTNTKANAKVIVNTSAS